VSGRGLEKLKIAGIEVTCGVLQEDALMLNRGFIKRMTEIVLLYAVSWR